MPKYKFKIGERARTQTGQEYEIVGRLERASGILYEVRDPRGAIILYSPNDLRSID